MISQKDTISLYKLPKEVRFCKTCTISNQRPRITFNSDGVCSACQFAEYKKANVDWSEREKELEKLLDRVRRKDNGYEILVPSSGGKDSGFVAHELAHKYKMHVLTVTWSPHLYTDIGWRNFQALIHKGGIDNILGTPNGDVHRTLTKLAFEILGDPFQPFVYGQANFPLQIASKFRIPLIMYGENGEGEYGGDRENAMKPCRHCRTRNRYVFSGIPPEDLVKYGIGEKDLVAYMAPPEDEMAPFNGDIYFYGYYKKWVPQENYYYCVKNTGFAANPVRTEGTYSKYASLDDKIDGFHYYLGYIKFGIGRTTSDTAHEIRDGHLTLEEGKALVRKYDGEFPERYFKVFLEYCGITEDHFWKVIDSWRSPHIWKKVKGEWKLRHTVNRDGADD